MSLVKARQVDFGSKSVVLGCIRQFETANGSLVIPIMIQYIILLYYWINEKFTIHGDDTTIQDHGTMAKAIIYRYNTVYGNNKVINLNDSSIRFYKWTFKIETLRSITTI